MPGPAADLFSSREPGVDFYRVANPKAYRIFQAGDYLDRWTPIQTSLTDLLDCEIGEVSLGEAF